MTEVLINRKLMIQFQTGIDKDGKDILKTKTFNNIRLDSSEENLSKFSTHYGRLSGYSHVKTLVADYYPIKNADLL